MLFNIGHTEKVRSREAFISTNFCTELSKTVFPVIILKILFHWRPGVVFITSAQLHSTNPELRFSAQLKLVPGKSILMVRISDNDPDWK